MPIISPRTKHIALPYYLFWSNIQLLDIEVISINTNDHLEKQFIRGPQEGNFDLVRKDIMKW